MADKVLVLGGTGFIGRHAAAAIRARGHAVVIGTRNPGRASSRLPPALHCCALREVHFESSLTPAAWSPLLDGIDVVVNSVGILRERGNETYERLHHLAPAALAGACAEKGSRMIHVSALGLIANAKSRFLRSKRAGEHAISAAAGDYSIVRPSLLDGEGGYGAKWLRLMARGPIHFYPANAHGRTAALDVRDLGHVLSALCEMRRDGRYREVELGGSTALTMSEYLDALRAMHTPERALKVPVPAWLARAGSHVCDLLHFSPYSYGHLELMQHDNLPRVNLLPALLGRDPTPVGKGPQACPASDPAPVPVPLPR